jgi:hypothetical protein
MAGHVAERMIDALDSLRSASNGSHSKQFYGCLISLRGPFATSGLLLNSFGRMIQWSYPPLRPC